MNSKDVSIRSEALRRLTNTKQFKTCDITVEVKDRMIVLNGIVPNYRDRLLAYKQIKEIDGVLEVKNNLSIAFSSNEAIPDDNKLKHVCETILEWMANIDATKVEVSVKTGIITLRGVVNEYQQKVYIDDIISSLKGVLDIKNELAVIPSEMIKDELIAANILSVFRNDSLLSAAAIDVIVNKGEVALKGKVSSYKEVTQAYEIAIYSSGVKMVNNYLQVVDK